MYLISIEFYGRNCRRLSSWNLLSGEEQGEMDVLTDRWPVIQGKGLGGLPPPPLFLDQTEAWRPKKIFLRLPPPPYHRVWMTRPPSPPPPIWMYGSTIAGYHGGTTCQVLFSESAILVFTFTFFPGRHVHIICVQESEACFLVSWVSFSLLSCWSTFLPAAVLKELWTILLGKMFRKNSMFMR